MNKKLANQPRKLGIDLGGSKIEAVLLDQAGEMVWRERVATPAQDYLAILQAIQQLTQQAEAVAGHSLAVGIGTPGAISTRSGLLRNSNTVCLNGQNLYLDLQQLLQRPLRIQNDANCFALSEAMDGAAADYSKVFGVIIGTGTGGGVVWDKKLLSGRHAIAGEWGHNPLPWLQSFDVVRDCYCGNRVVSKPFCRVRGLPPMRWRSAGSAGTAGRLWQLQNRASLTPASYWSITMINWRVHWLR